MSRVGAFLADLVRLWREEGIRAALRLVLTRAYEQNVNLLYELRTTGIQPDLPPGWCVRVLSSEADPAAGLLVEAGAEAELSNFRRQAVAYLMCIEDAVVARLWHFPQSPLASRLGPDAAYVGKIFVKPDVRGQGIASLLLASMAARLPIGSRLIMEVKLSNISSQRSLTKSGAMLLGQLHTTECLTRLVRVHLDESARQDHSNP